MWDLLQSFLIRLGGGMFFPVIILFFFSFWGWRGLVRRTGSFFWLIAVLLVIFCWRFMWLASSGGRSDRYYILWGVAGILLIAPGVRGILRWAEKLRFRSLGISPSGWWGISLAITVAICIAIAFHSSGEKQFIADVAAKIQENAGDPNGGALAVMDATSEMKRLSHLTANRVPMISLVKLRQDNHTLFWQDFSSKWLAEAVRYDRVLLFVRQSPQRELDRYFKSLFPLKVIGDYAFHEFVYTLYLVEPAKIYSADQLAGLRESARTPMSLTVNPSLPAVIGFDRLFSLPAGEYTVETKARYGVRDDRAWYWQPDWAPPQIPQDLIMEAILWPPSGLPLARREIHITFAGKNENPMLPPASGNQSAATEQLPAASAEKKLPPPQVRRMIYFGYGVTQLSDLQPALPPGAEAVIHDRGLYSESFGRLLERNPRNIYWQHNQLLLTDGNIDTAMILLGQKELMQFDGASLLWPDNTDRLIAQTAEVVSEIRRARPDIRIVLGLLPYLYWQKVSMYHDPQHNISFYNQAVKRFNQQLILQYGDRRADGIYLISLERILLPEDISTRNPWILNDKGKQKILKCIGNFLGKEKK